MTLTQDYLKSILEYDPLTGVFLWKKQLAPRGKVGTEAGSLCKVHGYRSIRIHGRLYPAHHLAWLYVTGEMPTDILDHINTVRHDNRFENLRPATRQENLFNTGKRRHNTSGFKGVCFDRARGKWLAQIACEGKHFHLGRYETKEAAYSAYCRAAHELHGEFARVA